MSPTVGSDDDGGTVAVQKWTVPRDPSVPPGPPHDDDSDGIPNWC